MNRVTKICSVALIGLSLLLCISPATVKALPPETWTPGQEYEYFGHYFTEEYWTNDSITIERGNITINLFASYVNYNGTGAFQAFLLALGTVEDAENNTVFTLPYQFFGMHYTTPEGKEVFLGAVLAFLFAYKDENNSSLPDPGNEPFYYIIPYGFGNTSETRPEAEAIPVQELEEGHYRFGVTYRNLYARIIDANSALGFWFTLLFPFLVAKFSELTITYDIHVNTTSGEVVAETFYTVGQIEDVLLFGTIPVGTDFFLEDPWGIGASHYVCIFTSNYEVIPGTTTIGSGIEILENATITVGNDDERAFQVGTRGTYDLINETSGAYVDQGLPAYAALLHARLREHILISWQLPFSADLLATLSYALSDQLKTIYDGPRDLYEHADVAFTTSPLWYVTAFPLFGGYRVEHDPAYTAYTNIGQTAGDEGRRTWLGIALLAGAALIGVIVLVIVVVVVNKRNRGA